MHEAPRISKAASRCTRGDALGVIHFELVSVQEIYLAMSCWEVQVEVCLHLNPISRGGEEEGVGAAGLPPQIEVRNEDAKLLQRASKLGF